MSRNVPVSSEAPAVGTHDLYRIAMDNLVHIEALRLPSLHPRPALTKDPARAPDVSGRQTLSRDVQSDFAW